MARGAAVAAGRTGRRPQAGRERRQGLLQPQFPYRTDEPLRLQLPVLLLPPSEGGSRGVGLLDGGDRGHRPRPCGAGDDRGAYRGGRASRPRPRLLCRDDPPREGDSARSDRQSLYGHRTVVHDPPGGVVARRGAATVARSGHGSDSGRRRRDLRRGDPRPHLSRQGVDGRMARRARSGPPAGHQDQCHDPLRSYRGGGAPYRPPRPPACVAGSHGGLQRLHPAQIPQLRQCDVGGGRGVGDRGSADAGHEPHLSGQHPPRQGLLGDVRQGDHRTGARLRGRRHRRYDRRYDENLLHGGGRRPASPHDGR